MGIAIWEICVIVATAAFVALTMYSIGALLSLKAASKQLKIFLSHMKKDIQVLTEESAALIKTTNATIHDIKHKAEALNIFFKPLLALQKKPLGKVKGSIADKSAQILGLAEAAIGLYKKLKR